MTAAWRNFPVASPVLCSLRVHAAVFYRPQGILKMLKRLMIVVVLGAVGLLSISGVMATMLNVIEWM